MTTGNNVESSKRVKNIAAVLYLLMLAFVVGGTYLNQQQNEAASLQESNKAGLTQ